MGPLSAQDVAEYKRNGFILLESFIDESRIRELSNAIDKLIEEGKSLKESNETYQLEPFKDSKGMSTPRNIWDLDKFGEPFSGLARDSRILDVVEQLLCPNVELHHMKVNLKLPGSPMGGVDYTWHQDFVFFPHSNFDQITCNLFLDDTSRENGALSVVPGSQRLGPLNHRWSDSAVEGYPDDLLQMKCRFLEGRAGTLTLHHPLIAHGSNVNKTARSRRTILITYRSADALQLGVPIRTRGNGNVVRGEKPDMVRLQEMVFEDEEATKAVGYSLAEITLAKHGRVNPTLGRFLSEMD